MIEHRHADTLFCGRGGLLGTWPPLLCLCLCGWLAAALPPASRRRALGRPAVIPGPGGLPHTGRQNSLSVANKRTSTQTYTRRGNELTHITKKFWLPGISPAEHGSGFAPHFPALPPLEWCPLYHQVAYFKLQTPSPQERATLSPSIRLSVFRDPVYLPSQSWLITVSR